VTRGQDQRIIGFLGVFTHDILRDDRCGGGEIDVFQVVLGYAVTGDDE
jgi:hypothetical protein